MNTECSWYYLFVVRLQLWLLFLRSGVASPQGRRCIPLPQATERFHTP
jgi:hypothetical protein